MKLCIVTASVVRGDGQGRANYEIVWEAIRRGHQVTLLAKQVASDLQKHPQVTWVTFPVESVPSELLQGIAFAWLSGAWLRKHRHELDLVQVYGAVTSVPADVNTSQFVHSAWLTSSAHNSHQGSGLYSLYQWLYTTLNANWEKRAFREAKILIAVSEKIREELIDLGVPRDLTQVILNGVDLEEFSPGALDRQTLGLPTMVPMSLFAGDIRTNRKNLDTVLRALVKVPDLHLAVAGDTNQSPYPAMATQLGIQHRVHFLGFRRDIAALMQAVDFFVFPSRYEACTLVLLEAMASGLPTITATSAGGSEIVTSDCGIVLSDPEDVEALAQALRTLTEDIELRQKMGQASYTVAQQHSWVSKAQSYVNLFESLSQNISPILAFHQAIKAS
jgi:glycosyltransferase involved in cell wall biosynthesis